ncbi:MAG TPA: AbrB/MazE/SpoVT family DNA-binding domain-containing protein [Roseateles sp.]|uniref:AbrB/MazE/SpoVT family DNA-binding domain-containing protein n=1 Tax=Roseateles sp. TaxID=1971397 RepID=UPI002ED9252C
MSTLKLTQIGNSVGLILPKEVLARLKVEKGDVLYPCEAVYGVLLSPCSAEFEAQMRAAHDLPKQRRAVLRELAR